MPTPISCMRRESTRTLLWKCVNPAVNEGENCIYYQQDHIVQDGIWGMKQTFKKVLASDITSMRSHPYNILR